MRFHRRGLATVSAILGLLAAVPAAWAGSPYVALGDSYTAGPGIPNPAGPLYGCARSTQNYPQLLSAGISLPLTDASCSAATTVNMTQSQYAGDGTNPPQLDALAPDTQLVTLSIGGNDLPVAEFVATCAGMGWTNPMGAPCKAYYTRGGVDRGAQKADAVGPLVSAVIQGVRQRAPGARVLVVGYPSIVPTTASTACFTQGVPLAAGDLPYLDLVTRKLNGAIKGAAQANGVEFVDLYPSSLGHDVCKAANLRWVEGIIPGNIAAPVHPNLSGMQNAAARIRESLGY